MANRASLKSGEAARTASISPSDPTVAGDSCTLSGPSYSIRVPAGVSGGQHFTAMATHGRMATLMCPVTASAGDLVSFRYGSIEHKIDLDLEAVPAARIFLTLCACSSHSSLAKFSNPKIRLVDAKNRRNARHGADLAKYTLGDAGNARSVVMVELRKDESGFWRVVPCGAISRRKFCNAHDVARRLVEGLMGKGGAGGE